MLPSTYTLSTETIKLNAYRLLCLFYSNKEIARLSDPDQRGDPASALEKSFFSREMTHLLLSIAIGIRVFDDQMTALETIDPIKQKYLQIRDGVNKKHNCMMFDTMSLREVCNKIIHATTAEPHTQEGTESHFLDEYNWLGWSEAQDESKGQAGPEPESIKWKHLTGNIRLGGKHLKKQWWHFLMVPVFVEAIVELLTTESSN